MLRPARSLFAILAAAAIIAGPVGAQTGTRSAFSALREDGNGVKALDAVVALDVVDLPLADVLRSIRQQANLGLVFRSDLPGLDRRVTLREWKGTAARALLRVLDGSGLEVRVSTAGQAVLVPRADEPGASVAVTGTVSDVTTGTPIAEAEVFLEDVHRRTFTDPHGVFTLPDIATGAHVLGVRRMGYAPQRTPIDTDDGSISLSLTPVPTPLSAVVVVPGMFGVLEESAAPKRTLTRAEIETSPQIGDDIFRAVNRLPGVVGSDLSASFGIRGSRNREVLLRLDGLDLVEPYHLKDIDAALSIVDLDAIGGVDVMTGGFAVEYGDRLAGVFDMRSASISPGPPRTTLGLSLTNARVASAGTFANERGDWLLSARRGYLDLALKLGGASDRISPRYYDMLGKVDYHFDDRFKLSAHLLQAGDKLRYHDSTSDPDLDSRYGSSYTWLTLDTEPADRLETTTVLAAGRITWNRIGHRVASSDHGALDVIEDRSYVFGELRQQLQLGLSDRLLLRTGFELATGSADYAYDSAVQTYQVVNHAVVSAFDTTTVAASPDGTRAGAWLSTRLRPVAPVTVEVGARWDRHSWIGDASLTPRVNAAVTVDPNTTIRAAWGRYVQGQGLYEMQAQDGVTHFWPAERAEQRVIGIERSFPHRVEARLDAYDRRMSDLHPEFVNLNNNNNYFPELTASRFSISPTDGVARGLEFLVRHQAFRGFDWSASYALSSTRERVDGVLVPQQRDQRHALGLSAAWTTDGRWRFAAAWEYHTGWPQTPAALRVDTLADGKLFITRDWLLDQYDNARLPPYHRMDVRVSHEIRTRKGRLFLSIDVYNLYDRENARALQPYLQNLQNDRPVIGYSVDSLLPRLPSFGIQWEF